MDDSLLVRRFERLRNLAGDRERLVRRNWSLRDAVGECRSFHQLEHQRMRAARVLETVNRRDVWMIQRGKHLCLAAEPCEPIGVERKRLGQHFQRDVTIQLAVARAIDLAHAARAECGHDLIGAQSRAHRQRHRGLAFNRPI